MSLRDWWSDLMAGDPTAVALLIIGGMLAALAYAVVKAVVGGLWSFGRSQVEQQFWRDGGKLTTLMSVTVLVLAYAFYRDEQPRPLARALVDLAHDKLLAVLPLAILTQWVLLWLFWILFGLLMKVPLAQLIQPAVIFNSLLVFSGLMVLFTLVFLGVARRDWGAAAGWYAVVVAANYLLIVMGNNPRNRPSDRRGWTYRWRIAPQTIVLVTLLFTVLFAVIAAVVWGVQRSMHRGVPSLAGALHGELIAMSAVFLLACLGFKTLILKDNPGTPKVLLNFIELTTALSAVMIALIGLSQSPVKLGSTPVWVIAVGPPLLVAVAILLFNLVPRSARTEAPRWGLCLAASVAVALLVVPGRVILTDVLTPVAALIPWPDL
ncbi:hypothetical protein ACFO1B_39285 [Dactylosporangium siamense]|uniref:Uncharacterized protein n=1 Tax=Dactylosporangium siamense TaxID=685454 RepID=A0A919UG54_9ACTN|nr:hypothetical protein [Dactylosporangium siamense]GIG50275.1 hypothetical protein Dsi01nite_083160 [Dactylosporangium siamense]